MKKDKSLIDFPCDFQIKVIGDNNESFFLEIAAITRKHFPDIAESSFRCQASQQGNYLAISITVYAHDQTTLDALYLDLNKHPDKKMVL